MKDTAMLTPQELRELFTQTAVKRNLTPEIVEKDFWVCWVLQALFESRLSERIVFKGGTSLSKVYGYIERFSEDIDLILNWSGNTVGDPLEMRSKRKQGMFNEELLQWSNRAIREEIFPVVQGFCAGICTPVLEETGTGDPIITIGYPPAVRKAGYLRPEIRLEIGALAAWEPYRNAVAVPYAAEEFPHLFRDASARVKVTTDERTFWEKATILHAEAGRPSGNKFRPRYARHYYDLVMLARHADLKRRALANLALLERVVAFKKRFYAGSSWTAYDAAKPGTFRLLPPDYFMDALARDYSAMAEMIYGERPAMETILAELRALQDEINALESLSPDTRKHPHEQP